MKESLDEMERVFLALGDKTRIKLIGLMGEGEVSVNDLCESLDESQPKVSRHLAYLRAMGLVNTRRDGKWIYYSLSWPESQLGSRVFRDTLNWIGSLSNRVHEPVPATVRDRNLPGPEAEMKARGDIYGRTHMKCEERDLEVYLL